MKVAIAVTNNRENAYLSEVFGRSAYFFLCSQDAPEILFLKNPYADAVGGAGIKIAQLLIEKKCDAVIAKNIGTQALHFLNAADIKVYQGLAAQCKENLLLLQEGNLPEQ